MTRGIRLVKKHLINFSCFTRLTLCRWVFLACFFIMARAQASEKVSIQLAWKHQFQFAGYYAALEKGYYSQAGLDVTIIEGGEGKFAREVVMGAAAQYGVAGSELLLHRIDGDPFVVLAPIFQHSPSILLASRDAGISTLQDLIGKRVMLLPGNKDADIMAAFLNEGIPLDAIQRMDQTYDIRDLMEGRTDAVSAYTTNEPWQLLQNNIEPAIISPQTYGVIFTVTVFSPRTLKLTNTPCGSRHSWRHPLKGGNMPWTIPKKSLSFSSTTMR